jgi:hypothetical protein
VQQRRQPGGRILLHRRLGHKKIEMTLSVYAHALPLLDDVRRDTRLQKQRRARVTQPVELDRPHACRLRSFLDSVPSRPLALEIAVVAVWRYSAILAHVASKGR